MTQRIIEILAKNNNPSAWIVKCYKLLNIWNTVVDGRVGRQTEAVKIKNRVLYVMTTSSAWAQELTFLKKEIMKKFNEKAGEEAIKDIRFMAKGEKIAGRA